MVKKGFFFSLDALIATVLIVSVLLVVPTLYISREQNLQPEFFSSDIIDILSTVKLSDINNSEIAALIENSSVTDYNKTITEQVLRYVVNDETEIANELLTLATQGLLPSNFNFGMYIEGYEDAIYMSGNISARQLISSKQMVSGIEKNRSIEGYASRVFLSGFNEMISAVYIYLGGYVGDGLINIKVNLPADVNSVGDLNMEFDSASDFELYINGNFSGRFNITNSTDTSLFADRWNISDEYLTYFSPGENNITFYFNDSSKSYIGGGYIKLNYITSELSIDLNHTQKKIYLPGINGVVNLYDSFYLPGLINNMELLLNVFTNTELYLNIGNSTVVEINSSDFVQNIVINNTHLSNIFPDYDTISRKTIPLRFGVKNVTFNLGGKSDAVLITDRTSSMDDCDVVINCSVPGICDSSPTCHERRDKVAQDSDKQFISEMLNVEGNYVGLVGYGKRANPICSFHEMSNENQSLQSRVDDYYNEWCGHTCISCGIVGAMELLVENKVLYGTTIQSDKNKTEVHIGDSGNVAETKTFDHAINKSKFIKGRITVFGEGLDTDEGYKNCVFLNDNYLGRMCMPTESSGSGLHTCIFPIKKEWLPSVEEERVPTTITTQSDFESGTTTGIDTITYPDNVTISGFWWNSRWPKRRQLYFNMTDVAVNLTDFPLLVVLDQFKINYSITQDNGEDIRFVDADGTVLSHEIEKWDESGESFIWVNIPILDGNSDDDYMYIYYGNESESDGQDVDAVWNSNYLGVWHLDETVDDEQTSGVYSDSSINGNDGSQYKNDDAIGYVGTGQNFDGNSDYIDLPSSDTFLSSENQPITIAAIFNADSIGSGSYANRIMTIHRRSSASSRFALTLGSSDNVRAYIRDLGTVSWPTEISPSEWHYAVITYNGTHFVRYLDGYRDGDPISGSLGTGGSYNAKIGTYSPSSYRFHGIIDELRVMSAAASEEWVFAQNKSFNDNIIIFGDSEDKSAGGDEYMDMGIFLSPVYDSGGTATFELMSWDETLDVGTGITAEIRTGDTPVPDISWDNYDWSGDKYTNSSKESVVQSPARYFQVRVNLTTNNSNVTPILHEVLVNYSVLESSSVNVTVTGANEDDCFGTDGEQDDWDAKDFEIRTWESPTKVYEWSHLEDSTYTLDDGDETLSIAYSSWTDYTTLADIKSGLLTFEAIDVGTSYYDCVFVNDNYIGRIDYQKWSGDNEWQNVTFDVPVFAMNSTSSIIVTITSGTTSGCKLTDSDNDWWQVRKINLTLVYTNVSSVYDRYMSMLVMSDGGANTKIGFDASYGSSTADDEAVEKACKAADEFGIRIYSVAFGDGSDESLMEDVACCDNCDNAYNANNAEDLIEIYRQIADDIIEFQYSAQTANITGNISTELFSDSYLFFNYSPDITLQEHGKLPITFETPVFGNNYTNGSFSIPSGAVVMDSKLTSYSADRWTSLAMIKNQSSVWTNFFNLSEFGDTYTSLGDPYIVNIPKGMISDGENEVIIQTSLGEVNGSVGSHDDRAIITLGLSMGMNYTGIFALAEGCTWDLEYEDDTGAVVSIPSDYYGSQECTYNASTNCNQDYGDDAIDNSFCHMLSQIDFDDDGKLIVKFDSENVEVSTFQIGNIPFMWGPTIFEVRVWG